ncbi:MAG TPA: type II toxin-antitoxin system death-on-curing family toxin [Bacteroidota bacterium]|nr:type II toxin-antitoxin system death-on-curing family toxin [Bacteroidota bacterium]
MIIELHDLLIRKFGGITCVGDFNLLEAALSRPFSGLADGTQFFPTLVDQAAALIEAIIEYHPFIDGNKRTAIVTANYFLGDNGLQWKYDDPEIVEFALAIARQEMKFEQIRAWISKRVQVEQ